MTVVIGGVTYLTMGDSIVPGNLPAGLDAYAGYDNGNWPDYQAIAAQHGSSYLLDLSVAFQNVGTGGDFEEGDMDPAEAVPYVTERHQAGVGRPVAYASIEGYMPEIVGNLNAAGFARSGYRLLSAHYGKGQHVCGPSTCGSPIQCDGTQWIDHGPWDESLLMADFFAVPAPPTYPTLEGTLNATDTVTNGWWYVDPHDGHCEAYGGAPFLGGMNTLTPNPMTQGIGALSGCCAVKGSDGQIGLCITLARAAAAADGSWAVNYVFTRDGTYAAGLDDWKDARVLAEDDARKRPAEDARLKLAA